MRVTNEPIDIADEQLIKIKKTIVLLLYIVAFSRQLC
jgi:hypothetical protein